MDVDPGVDFSQLVWSLTTQQQDDGGTAVWESPGAGGTGPDWSGNVASIIDPGTSTGRLTIRADMTYAGPNLPCRIVVNITNNNEVAASAGITRCTVSQFPGGLFASMPLPPPTFTGQFTLDFTATAGALFYIIDFFSSQPGGLQPSPMTLSCAGNIINL